MLNTQIQWTEASVNFWIGCKKVGTECLNCYWYRDADRYGKDPILIKRTSDKTFYAALKWKEPKRIFTCSWSDFFIALADPWRDDAWDVIRKTPKHSWQVLTKRTERIIQCLPTDWTSGWDQVWLGTSVGIQKTVDIRVPQLLSVPAVTRFLSCEPLLERLDLTAYLQTGKIHWAIVGGESGNDTGKFGYRPCELDWIEDILNQCKRYNVPAFTKQLGTYQQKKLNMSDKHGGIISEFPPQLQVRQYPIFKKNNV
jgi:protein gp37